MVRTKLLKTITIVATLQFVLSACDESTDAGHEIQSEVSAPLMVQRGDELPRSYVVVPNRSDSTVAIVANDETHQVLRTIGEMDLGFQIEPIYASHLWRQKLIVVSDRLTSHILFFDDATFSYLGRAPASRGLFHTWPSGNSRQLFVTADIDNHIDVFRIRRLGNRIFYRHRVYDVNALVPNGTPHDIVADYRHFYIGVRIAEESRGVLLKVNNRTLATVGSLDFSFDVHLGIPLHSPFLLVAESVESQLNLIDRRKFQVVSTLDGVTGAHGLWWDTLASRIFVSDFNSTGPAGVFDIRRTPGNPQMEIAHVLDLPDTKAHNMTADFDLGQLYVTHSGPGNNGELNTNVSVIDITDDTPQYTQSVTTGSNPLGITLVQRCKINHRHPQLRFLMAELKSRFNFELNLFRKIAVVAEVNTARHPSLFGGYELNFNRVVKQLIENVSLLEIVI